MSSKHKNINNYYLILSNLLQKFNHKNTDIWIWKYCLLKIYLDYRELMNTSLLTVEGWLKVMNTNDNNFWKRKIQEGEIFRTLLSSSALRFPSSLVLSFCLVRKLASLLIDDEVELESILSLHAWQFLKSVTTCRYSRSLVYSSLQNEKSFCIFIR